MYKNILTSVSSIINDPLHAKKTKETLIHCSVQYSMPKCGLYLTMKNVLPPVKRSNLQGEKINEKGGKVHEQTSM